MAIMMGLGEAESESDPLDMLPSGADSTAAVELMNELPQSQTTAAIVLWTADEGELGKEALAAIQEEAGEQQVVPSQDGTAAFTVVPVEEGDSDAIADQVGDLRDQVE